MHGRAIACAAAGPLFATLAACSPPRFVGDSGPGGDAAGATWGPCLAGRECQSIVVDDVDEVDLLFMVDDSASMGEEQASLISELPRLVRVLTTGDLEPDGSRDFRPAASLHVGVVTSNMGAGPSTDVPTCAQGLGDDGILRNRSRDTSGSCVETFPSRVFDFERDRGDDPSSFAASVACVADVGTAGCGFEQQLEAALKAVTPSVASSWTRAGYVPPRFTSAGGTPDGVPGHADGANEGFLRAASVLAVILVTDEEDCSVRDYGLFVPGEERFTSVPLNLRCDAFGDEAMGVVQPVERYVDGFLGLRSSPSLLVFSGIIGIPPHTEGLAADGNFAAVLSDPSMTPRVNAMGTNVEPSCSTADGVAFPPVRIVQTASGLAAGGARVSLSSICSSSFQPAIDGLVETIADALGGACLPGALPVAPDGLVDCELYELLPTGWDCSGLPGRRIEQTLREASGASRQLCRVTQIDGGAPASPGWYLDDSSFEVVEACGAGSSRIAYTASAPPPPTGTELRLDCDALSR